MPSAVNDGIDYTDQTAAKLAPRFLTSSAGFIRKISPTAAAALRVSSKNYEQTHHIAPPNDTPLLLCDDGSVARTFHSDGNNDNNSSYGSNKFAEIVLGGPEMQSCAAGNSKPSFRNSTSENECGLCPGLENNDITHLAIRSGVFPGQIDSQSPLCQKMPCECGTPKDELKSISLHLSGLFNDVNEASPASECSSRHGSGTLSQRSFLSIDSSVSTATASDILCFDRQLSATSSSEHASKVPSVPITAWSGTKLTAARDKKQHSVEPASATDLKIVNQSKSDENVSSNNQNTFQHVKGSNGWYTHDGRWMPIDEKRFKKSKEPAEASLEQIRSSMWGKVRRLISRDKLRAPDV